MLTDTNYNPAIMNGGVYEITKLDTSTASTGKTVSFDGTNVVWATPIATSALASSNIFVGNAGNVATAVPMSGIVHIDNTGATSIPLTSAHILVGNGSNLAESVAVSGNATISNTGAVAVTDLTIASQATGDILYFNGTHWVRLASGTVGQVLTMGASVPAWA